MSVCKYDKCCGAIQILLANTVSVITSVYKELVCSNQETLKSSRTNFSRGQFV